MAILPKYQAIFYGISDRVLHSINRARHQAKNYPIAYLQLEDPSYSEIVERLQAALDDMKAIDELETAKLQEYVDLMQEMTEAIATSDKDKLDTIIAILDEKPFL
jgi:hypothetical protein